MKLAMRMMRCCTPRNHAWTPVSRAADFPGLRGQTLDFPDFPGLRLKFRRSKFRNSKVHGHASRFALQPKHAVGRFDVVQILQKRHQPSFRCISTGDFYCVVYDEVEIAWF
jgi:hypothetical protein